MNTNIGPAIVLAAIAAVYGAQAADPWPLGTLTYNDGSKANRPITDPLAPAGWESRGVTVTCPGVLKPWPAFWSRIAAYGDPIGVAVLYSPSTGTRYIPENLEIAEVLRQHGYVVYMTRGLNSWWDASNGERAGIAKLAGRVATLQRHIYELEAPLSANFRVHGNSGGSAQVGYPITFYNADYVDVAVMSGGPPFSSLVEACLGPWWLNNEKRNSLDHAFGVDTLGAGPCYTSDPFWGGEDWQGMWNASSLAVGGNDYKHYNTAIRFIQGENDQNMQDVAWPYAERIGRDVNNNVGWFVVPDTGHFVPGTPQGMSLVIGQLLQEEAP